MRGEGHAGPEQRSAPRAVRAIRGRLKEEDFHLARSIGRGKVLADRYGGLAISLPMMVLAGILIVAMDRPGALVPLGVMFVLVLLEAAPALHVLRRMPVRFVLDAAGVRAAFDDGVEFGVAGATSGRSGFGAWCGGWSSTTGACVLCYGRALA